MSLEDFINAEQKRLDEQREAYLKDKDYKSFVKWNVGDNPFELYSVVPRESTSFGKERKVFRIVKDDEEFDWAVTPESPMYRQIIYDFLEIAPVDLVLTRVGMGKDDTRYHLRKAE